MTEFLDLLPAVFREQDELSADGFLAGFLQAFEDVFATVQVELDGLDELLALSAEPLLAEPAGAGATSLRLDSAAALWPGDFVQLGRPAVEFARVRAVTGEPEPPELHATLPRLTPTIVELESSLRFDHARRTPALRVGPVVATAALGATVLEGEALLAVPDRRVLAGDVIEVEGELLFVVSVDGARLDVAPALLHGHAIATPMSVHRSPLPFSPGTAYSAADRTGPQRVLVYRTRAAQDDLLFLDSLEGLEPGSILWIRDPDAVEFVTVEEVRDEAVRLAVPVTYSHTPGVAVEDVGRQRGLTVALEAAGTSFVEAPGLQVRPGDVIDVDGEPVQVVAVAGARLDVHPALQRAHRPGAPVARVLPAAGGTALLGWFAGWLGLTLRADRGERFNRELVRRAGVMQTWRGTRRGLEAFLAAWLRGEARVSVRDAANPMQLGLVSTLGVDSVICGWPDYFWVELDAEPANRRMAQPEGIKRMLGAALDAVRRERPTHLDFHLIARAPSMGFELDPEWDTDARVGDTTLSWTEPVVIPGDEQKGWLP